MTSERDLPIVSLFLFIKEVLVKMDWLTDLFGGGDAADKLDLYKEVLKTWSGYLSPTDFIHNVWDGFLWGLIKFFYGIANWASELISKAFSLKSALFGNGSKIFGMQADYVNNVVFAIMIIVLIWLAVKMVISRHPPQVKNVLFQVFISILLITNMGNITTQIMDLGIQAYNAATGTTGEDTTSSIPFSLVKDNTNDLLVMAQANFAEKNGKVYSHKNGEVTYGHNNIKKEDFSSSRIDTSMIINEDYVKGIEDKKAFAGNDNFDVGALKYKLVDSVDKNGNQIDSVIGMDKSIGGLIAKVLKPGYARYTIDFLPTLIGLIALAFAFLFATFVIAKSFLELAIMQIIGVLVASTDLETGEKTKKVVEALFQASLTIAFTGIELAFYKAVLTALNNLHGWIFTIVIVAATMMLITGSDKVAMFFGVDTGAQKGWKSAAAVAGGAFMAGRGAKSVGRATQSVAKGFAAAPRKIANLPANISKAPAKARQKLDDFKLDYSANKASVGYERDRANLGMGTVQGQKQRRQELDNLNQLKDGMYNQDQGFATTDNSNGTVSGFETQRKKAAEEAIDKGTVSHDDLNQTTAQKVRAGANSNVKQMKVGLNAVKHPIKTAKKGIDNASENLNHSKERAKESAQKIPNAAVNKAQNFGKDKSIDEVLRVPRVSKEEPAPPTGSDQETEKIMPTVSEKTAQIDNSTKEPVKTVKPYQQATQQDLSTDDVQPTVSEQTSKVQNQTKEQPQSVDSNEPTTAKASDVKSVQSTVSEQTSKVQDQTKEQSQLVDSNEPTTSKVSEDKSVQQIVSERRSQPTKVSQSTSKKATVETQKSAAIHQQPSTKQNPEKVQVTKSRQTAAPQQIKPKKLKKVITPATNESPQQHQQPTKKVTETKEVIPEKTRSSLPSSSEIDEMGKEMRKKRREDNEDN